MIRPTVPLLLTITIAIFVVAGPSVFSDDSAPGVKKLKLREMKPPAGYVKLETVEELVFPGGKSGRAFGAARSQIGIDVINFRLSNRGKASSANRYSYGNSPVAFWLDNVGSADAGSPAAGKGLILYSYGPAETAYIYAGQFDSLGISIIGPDQEVFKITDPSAVSWNFVYITAAAGPSSIAVAVSARYYIDENWGVGPTMFYFLELDFDGQLIGQVSKIALPGGGNDLAGRAFRPAWNGAKWLIPAFLYDVQESRYKVVVITAGSIAPKSVSQGGSGIKIKNLFELDENCMIEWDGESLQFLTGVYRQENGQALPSAKGQMLNLLCQYNNRLPYEEQKVKRYKVVTRIQKIRATGGKKGKPIDVQLGQWNTKLKPDDAKYVQDHTEYLSSCVPLEDGRFLLAQTRNIYRSWTETPPEIKYDYDLQVVLFAVDPNNGAVELLADKSQKLTGWWLTPVILRAHEGKAWMIFNFWDHEALKSCAFFAIY